MRNERLRALLLERGETPDKLAEAVHVDAKTVERWITKGRVPYRKHRYEVAAFFGVGPQRGVGLLLTAMGLVTVLVSLAAAASRPLRKLEAELPEISSLDEDDSGQAQPTPAEYKPADVMIARQVLVTGENQ